MAGFQTHFQAVGTRSDGVYHLPILKDSTSSPHIPLNVDSDLQKSNSRNASLALLKVNSRRDFSSTQVNVPANFNRGNDPRYTPFVIV